MIGRIAENWLTNANERGYEIPFAQCLIAQGYTVVHISSHGQLEQGKDIISIDPEGNPCCFQLKGEKITLGVWRKNYGEINDLVDIPIIHPKFEGLPHHRSFLVTNQEITDPVRATIVNLRPKWIERKCLPLEVMAKHEVLKLFVDSHGAYLPVEIEDFHSFLELILTKGDRELDKAKYSAFLESFVLSVTPTNIEITRMLSSLVILCQYILGDYEKEQNHINIIEGWMIFLNYLFYLVEKNSLDGSVWSNTYNLIFDKINFQLDLLKSEVFDATTFLQEDWDGGLILQIRLGLLGGWPSSFELVSSLICGDYKLDERVYDFIRTNYENMKYWGESATPYFIVMSMFLDKFGDSDFSNSVLRDTLNELVLNNNKKDCIGVPDPYWAPEMVIQLEYEVLDEPYNRKNFIGHSYHLTSLVNLLVKKGRKATLEAIWQELSHTITTKIVPKKLEDYFLFRTNEADVISKFYEAPQSFMALEQEYDEDVCKDVPKILKSHLPFVLYMILIMPHKLNTDIIKIMCENKMLA